MSEAWDRFRLRQFIISGVYCCLLGIALIVLYEYKLFKPFSCSIKHIQEIGKITREEPSNRWIFKNKTMYANASYFFGARYGGFGGSIPEESVTVTLREIKTLYGCQKIVISVMLRESKQDFYNSDAARIAEIYRYGDYSLLLFFLAILMSVLYNTRLTYAGV
jgi:hypothetical protein